MEEHQITWASKSRVMIAPANLEVWVAYGGTEAGVGGPYRVLLIGVVETEARRTLELEFGTHTSKSGKTYRTADYQEPDGLEDHIGGGLEYVPVYYYLANDWEEPWIDAADVRYTLEDAEAHAAEKALERATKASN